MMWQFRWSGCSMCVCKWMCVVFVVDITDRLYFIQRTVTASTALTHVYIHEYVIRVWSNKSEREREIGKKRKTDNQTDREFILYPQWMFINSLHFRQHSSALWFHRGRRDKISLSQIRSTVVSIDIQRMLKRLKFNQFRGWLQVY